MEYNLSDSQLNTKLLADHFSWVVYLFPRAELATYEIVNIN